MNAAEAAMAGIFAGNGSGGGGGSGTTYSLSEVRTNDVWIDGKPIYRRTVAMTQWDEEIDATSWNIDTFFVDYAHSYFKATNYDISYTSGIINGDRSECDVYYDITNKTIHWREGGLYSNTLDAAYYTFLYTKTTDTGAT